MLEGVPYERVACFYRHPITLRAARENGADIGNLFRACLIEQVPADHADAAAVVASENDPATITIAHFTVATHSRVERAMCLVDAERCSNMTHHLSVCVKPTIERLIFRLQGAQDEAGAF